MRAKRYYTLLQRGFLSTGKGYFFVLIKLKYLFSLCRCLIFTENETPAFISEAFLTRLKKYSFSIIPTGHKTVTKTICTDIFLAHILKKIPVRIHTGIFLHILLFICSRKCFSSEPIIAGLPGQIFPNIPGRQ